MAHTSPVLGRPRRTPSATHTSLVSGPIWSLCFLPSGEMSSQLTTEEASLSERTQAEPVSTTAQAARKEGDEKQAFISE